MEYYLVVVFTIFIIFFISIFLILKSRNMELWILSYIYECIKKKKISSHRNVYFCLADHYEPYFGSVDKEVANKRVEDWCKKYPKVAEKHKDSAGNMPKHSYFYPCEEYDEDILNKLKLLCDQNLGDVDIHLHHDNDTAENLEKTLTDFKELLYKKHNLLRKDSDGNIIYGFIHGNWALDNSRPDGKWCGVDNEINILLKTGCMYDMTMPSAPSDTQTKTINSIYFTHDDGKCKSHNTGKDVKVGDWPKSDELLLIQGPLTLNWKNRKFGLIPRIESGELSADAPPTEERVKLWEKCHVSIVNADNDIFIKLHTHGLESQNVEMFFELNGFDILWSALEEKFRDRKGYSLYYVTAWEMYEKIKQISTDD